MCFLSFIFPPSTLLFPPASTVQQYLESYATHFSLHQYVRLNTHVTTAFWDSSADVWHVKLENGQDYDYDFLVVANGHYREPKYPDTRGLDAWLKKGKAKHSVYYRNPDAVSGSKKIMVVGGGPSAIDLCYDMRTSCPGLELVVHSIASGLDSGRSNYPPDASDYKKKGKVKEYGDPEKGEVVFEDGTVEKDVDFVFVATGYAITFPFLHDQLPEKDSASSSSSNPISKIPLTNSTRHVFPLAKHLFPLNASFPPHVIAFPGLPHRIAPFPIFEDQALAIVRVIAEGASAISIPDESALLTARLKRIAESEPNEVDEDGEEIPDPFSESMSRLWFRFGQHEPFAYRKELHEFADPSKGPWEPHAWEIELWDRRDAIRAEWKELVKEGKAEAWVKGVGEKGGEEGIMEWVEVCRKLMKRHDEKTGCEQVDDVEKLVTETDK